MHTRMCFAVVQHLNFFPFPFTDRHLPHRAQLHGEQAAVCSKVSPIKLLAQPSHMPGQTQPPTRFFFSFTSECMSQIRNHPPNILNFPCYAAVLFFSLNVSPCSSSTFKDPERVSLRDSGHGDSDQADSDQDTNKGSCCDMSAKEALKMKATGLKPQPLEQGESPSNLTS